MKKSTIYLNSFVLVILSQLIFTGCKKAERHPASYVARVNNTYLTYDEFKKNTDGQLINEVLKNDYIYKWIDNELLYQEAVKKGITNSIEYKDIIEKNKKEIAIALFLNNISNSMKSEADDKTLNDYFLQNKEDYISSQNSYLFDYIIFNNATEATRFITKADKINWENYVMKNNGAVVAYSFNKFAEENDLDFITKKSLRDLKNGTISKIISENSNDFIIFKLLKKYSNFEIPDFFAVKNIVRDRYFVYSRKNYIANYIKQLYTNNSIEIKINIGQ